MRRFWHQSAAGLLLAIAFLLLGSVPTLAQTFNSGSTGADGVLSPPSSVPPGTTVNGSTYTIPLLPSGLFNFTTITVPSGTTVTFKRNAANTPVVLLATGAVTIAGTLNVTGENGGAVGRPGAGGPGGFDGGPGGDGVTTATAGAGLGPGGAVPGSSCGGAGGSYGTQGTTFTSCGTPGSPGATYGTTLLRPIIGGSGGAGGSAAAVPGSAGFGGGGGGGAVILASSGTLTVSANAQIVADGGGFGTGSATYYSGGGSGGAIRLIATTISVAGNLYARGGVGYFSGSGGLGRIRLEGYTVTVLGGGTRTPEATQGLPQPVFPSAGQPGLTIASVGGIAAPATPSGSVLAAPDILLPTTATNPLEVTLTASNIPLGTVIQVTATPAVGAKTTATSSGLTGTLASSTATASVNLSLTQTSILTATATFPLVASAGEGPLYAEGEEVTHIKVATLLGGQSTLTYVTRSGREIVVR